MSDNNPLSAELGITAADMGVETPPDKAEKLFGQSFEIKRLENGATIPVGGINRFNDETDIEVVGDFDHFSGLLQEMHDVVAKQNLSALEQWLQSQHLSLDPKILASVSAFTTLLEKKYPTVSQHAQNRSGVYQRAKDGDGKAKLSDVFESKGAECAEIAALAQYFLQKEGTQSSYFSGEMLTYEINDETFSPDADGVLEPLKHTFIVLRDKDKQYVFDPTNPIYTPNGVYPSVYPITEDFDSEMRKGRQRFVAGTNMLTQKTAHFGVGSGALVSPTNIKR